MALPVAPPQLVQPIYNFSDTVQTLTGFVKFIILKVMKLTLVLKIFFLFLTSCMIINRYKIPGGHLSSNPIKTSPSFNQIVDDLSFFPINGSRFRLSELKNIKAIVIAMREKSCPLSEKYGPRLLSLEKEYSEKGVQFIYNYVGRAKAEQNAGKDLKKFNFKGPYVIDSRQKTINVLNAQTTGEVFILTPERRMIYRGPLDDPLTSKKHYVSDILSALVSGKRIEPKELPTPGRFISRPVIKKKSSLKM